jgi:hypothetical protein
MSLKDILVVRCITYLLPQVGEVVATKRNKLEFDAVRAVEHGAVKRGIAVIEHLIDIF